MTIGRVKPAGWALNEKLTSAQQNQVDLNTTYALDKRSGQTDTLASNVGVSGGIFVNSGGLFGLSSGSLANFAGSLEFSSTSLTAFKNGSHTVFDSGSILAIAGSSYVDFQNGSVLVADSGSMWIHDGYATFSDLRLSGTTKVNYHSGYRTFVRHFLPELDANSTWNHTDPIFFGAQANYTGTSTEGTDMMLDLGKCGLPNGAIITNVTANYLPPGSHVALPAQQPILKFSR